VLLPLKSLQVAPQSRAVVRPAAASQIKDRAGVRSSLENAGKKIAEDPGNGARDTLEELYAGSETSDLPLFSDKSYDLSGDDGAHARHGRRGSGSGGYYGESGGDGGDAGPSEKGEHGGRGRFRLSDPEGVGLKKRETVRIEADLEFPNGRPDARIDYLKVSPGSRILADVHGGDGGNGGDAGPGGRGGRGRRGADATRWTWGENGGRGGPGGDAGDPSDGAAPGDGGEVVAEVGRHDTDLLTLFRAVVRAGRPGEAGKKARGGDGGEGGPGGSSYHWTETHTESYTDSEGRSRTRTRVTSHYNPGGSRGSRGSRGNDSRYTAQDGPLGRDGRFLIVVLGEDGKPIGTFDEVYDLELLGFDIESRNADGIFEPGEEVRISKVRLRNRPGARRLATPGKQDIQIFFESNGYLGASRTRLTIPGSLQPGEEFEFDTDLKLDIRDIEDREIAQDGGAWRADQRVNPEAELVSVRQRFEDFENPRHIEIRFPIEVSAIHGAHSMGRGETRRIFWKIKNVSGRTFGSASELQRAIEFQLRHEGGEVDPGQIPFTDAQGNRIDLDDGFLRAIASLEPGGEVLIEGQVSLGRDAPLYSDAKLKLDLSLGRISAGSELRRIQSRAFSVRVAQTYRKTKGSQVLLVTNSASDRAEVESWKKMTESLGMSADVWDLSLNGFMDFSEDADFRHALLKDFAGRTVVLLNNEFRTSVGEDAALRRVQAEDFLSKGQFLKAAAEYAVNFLLVGETGSDEQGLLRSLLTPTREVDGADKNSEFSSPGVFLRELEAREADTVHPGDYTERADSVEVKSHKWWWRTPKADELEQVARETLAQVDIRFPLRRYIAAPRFDARCTERRPWYWLGLKKEWSLGVVEFRRTLDRTASPEAGAAVGLDVSGKAMHSAGFVRGRQSYLALFLALSMEQKLKAMEALYGRAGRGLSGEERRMAGEALVDAVLADIASEQAALRLHWWRGLSRRQVVDRLRNLVYLTTEHDFGLRGADPSSERGELLIRLAAGIYYLQMSQRLIRDWFLTFLPPFTRRNLRVSGITRSLVEDFIERVFPKSDHEKSDRRFEAREAMKAKAQAQWDEVEAARKASEKKIPRRVEAMARALSPLQGVTTDDELMLSLDDRVVPEARMDDLRRVEMQQDRRKAALERDIAAAKKALETKR